jgi:hypothetical protein
VLSREAGDAPLSAAVEEAFRRVVVGTIYGGFSEIMREIVAERMLGLPRVRSRSRPALTRKPRAFPSGPTYLTDIQC